MRRTGITGKWIAAVITAVLGMGVSIAQGQTNYIYVRGDGSGSDSYEGTNWVRAFATLNKAYSVCMTVSSWGTRPYDTTNHPVNIVYVQASAGGQAYAPVYKYYGYANPGPHLHVSFQGGWNDVEASPVQTGMSLVRGPGTPPTATGFYIYEQGHAAWKRLEINRFDIGNVTDGVYMHANGGCDNADIMLILSNCTIRAQNNGVYLEYPKSYGAYAQGGLCQVTAENVDIVAGLDGAGDGLYSYGAWLGSRVTASGTDPVTGYPRTSSITSQSRFGVRFIKTSFETTTYDAAFSNAVIYGCASNGICLNPLQVNWVDSYSNPYSNATPVVATLRNCTVVENGGDGLYAMAWSAGSTCRVTNSIFADNGGHGLNLNNQGRPGVFTCPEGYNCLFNDDLSVNGSVQTPTAADTTADPVFLARHNKPAKYYYLRFTDSPCYHSGVDGSNRGGYQNIPGNRGTIAVFR